MKKVFIISPHFPPISAPDHQRVRMALPYLEHFGWRPTVLAVSAEHVNGLLDPLQEQMLPKNLQVVRTGALPARWTRLAGVGSLAYRAFGRLRRAGDEMLRRKKFDLVFISTTLFPIMALGRLWRREFDVPYVLDFQDPWLSDYYERNPGRQPPGGRLKYGFSQLLAGRLEPSSVRSAAHIICVSKTYVEMFRRRYADVPERNFTVLPFGAAELDFADLERLRVSQSVFDPLDGKEHWVYIGRGGQDMALAVRAFFTALKRFADEQQDLSKRLHVHFIGTDYAPKERAQKTIEPIARELGLGEIVSEQTDRLPYFVTLRCLSDADALFVSGSDDPGYTASKLYPYILAKKPLLAVFHESSSVVDIIRRTRSGTVVTFGNGRRLKDVAEEIYRRWFACLPLRIPTTDWNSFVPYTAREMTRTLCDVFDRAREAA